MQPENATHNPQPANLLGRSIYWIYLLLFSLVVLLVYVQLDEGINHNTRAMIPELVYGRAEKPFVTRALLPALVRLTVPFISPGIVRAVQRNEAMRLTIDYLSQYEPPPLGLAVLVWMYISLIVFLAGLRYLMIGLAYPPGWIGAAPFVIQPVMMILLFVSYGYIYDLTILALFTWSIAFMQRGRYNAYLATLVLASLAKETAMLLVWVYILVNHGSLEWRRVIYQPCIVQVIHSLLLIVFADNPGAAFMEIHVQDWILAFACNPAKALAGWVIILPLAVAACWRWSLKPKFLRLAALGTFPILALLYLLGGNPGEIRIFMEAFPVAFLLMIWPYYVQNGG